MIGCWAIGNIFLVYIFSFVESANHEFLLRSYLFNAANYSPAIVPRYNLTDNVIINMTLTFIRLEGLFEKDNRLSQSIILDLTWKDDFLTWDPQQYGGITSFTTSGKDIWTPDLRVFNRLDSRFLENGLSAEKVQVLSNGIILASPFGDLATICTVNSEKFPVDCHTCSTIVGASVVATRQHFRWGTPAFVNRFSGEHAYWDVQDIHTKIQTGFVTIFSMVLKRMPFYYLCNIVFPASVLSFLCLLAFFIPIEEGERVGFSMTIFLTFMVLMVQVGNLIPESSRSFPEIGIFFLRLTVGSLLTIISSVVLSYHSSKPANDKGDQCRIFPATPSLSENKSDFENNDDVVKDSHSQNNKRPEWIRKIWKQIIKYGNRTLRHYKSPMKLFQLGCFVSCFVLCLYAHVCLFSMMNEDTCQNT